jgi:hypothetical protein
LNPLKVPVVILASDSSHSPFALVLYRTLPFGAVGSDGAEPPVVTVMSPPFSLFMITIFFLPRFVVV